MRRREETAARLVPQAWRQRSAPFAIRKWRRRRRRPPSPKPTESGGPGVGVHPRIDNNKKCKLPERRVQLADADLAGKLGITVEPVGARPGREWIEAPAELGYDPSSVARVSARADGVIVEVLVNVGDASEPATCSPWSSRRMSARRNPNSFKPSSKRIYGARLLTIFRNRAAASRVRESSKRKRRTRKARVRTLTAQASDRQSRASDRRTHRYGSPSLADRCECRVFRRTCFLKRAVAGPRPTCSPCVVPRRRNRVSVGGQRRGDRKRPSRCSSSRTRADCGSPFRWDRKKLARVRLNQKGLLPA